MVDGFGDGKTGLKTVVAEMVGGGEAVLGVAGEQASLPLCQDTPQPNDADTEPSARGPGRPKGAKNRNTEEWRKFLLGRYQSPLVALANVMSKPIDQLARDLGRKSSLTYPEALELMRIQLQCAKELAPYVHQKQPQADNNTGAELMTLIIQNGGATAQDVDEAGVMDIDFIDVESEQNQGLSENDDQKSNDLESNGSEQSGGGTAFEGHKPTDLKSERGSKTDV